VWAFDARRSARLLVFVKGHSGAILTDMKMKLGRMIDKRLNQVSHRRAPVDEVMRLVDRYRSRMKVERQTFYAWYKRDGAGALHLG